MAKTLTKIEEKAFRKYVDTFLKDAGKIDNPIARLDECIDILNCFEEGNCEDLREKVEAQIIEEKKNLESLVESAVKMTKETGLENLEEYKKAALRNTAQGLLLQEQITDYKELSEGLAARNRELKKEVNKLKEQLYEAQSELDKKLEESLKEVTVTSRTNEELKETLK